MRLAAVFEDPPSFPYVCFKCKTGKHAREFFVDLGMDTDFDGTIYLCNSCMEDLGRTTEMFMTQEQFEDKIALTTIELEDLRAVKNEFDKMKVLWATHFSVGLVELLNTLDEVHNGPRSGRTESTEHSTELAESIPTGNDESITSNAENSSGSDEDISGQNVSPPIVPQFS